jgi:glycosyltransferase involved in cell wall biosynthesis
MTKLTNIDSFQKGPVEEFANNAPVSPMVSVVVITYQHIRHIKQCLDSILMQDTDFAYEIILGDDESTDGTRELCVEYAKKHPDQIRLMLHSRENNMVINGNPTGRFNFVYNLKHSNGKYIALCEGDDYWTDPNKLQKQVDFLEANPDYSLCYHKMSNLFENTCRSFRIRSNQNFKFGNKPKT